MEVICFHEKPFVKVRVTASGVEKKIKIGWSHLCVSSGRKIGFRMHGINVIT